MVITSEGSNQTRTVTVTDVAGNSASFSSPAVNIDKRPPMQTVVVTPQPNANGWNNSAVTATFTCVDQPAGFGSGVASYTPPVVFANDGANQSASGVCTDVAGNKITTSVTGVNVDTTSPTAAIIVPSQGSTYILNQPVVAQYACADNLSLASCVGTVANGGAVATGSIGTFAFDVAAGDKALNSAAAMTSYSVQYNFSGFQAPLSQAGTTAAPSDSGSFTSGTQIPVAWQLTDFNNAFINPLTPVIASIQAFANPACSGAVGAGAILLYSNGNPVGTNTFAYDQANNRYLFTWDTSTMANGCYNLVLTLLDGASYATIVQLTGPAVSLIDTQATPGGDQISRGFYIASYPGVSLTQANLYFSATAAGTYTYSLTAHKGTYDGPVLGTSVATAVLDGTGTQDLLTSFVFTPITIAPGTTVAFVTKLVSGPSGATSYLGVSSCGFDAGCVLPGPVVTETEGTNPPLDTFRRNGIGLQIFGAN